MSVTPKSHRNKRVVAKSELAEYKDIEGSNKPNLSYANRKPGRQALTSLNNPPKISNNSLAGIRQNKPPVGP